MYNPHHHHQQQQQQQQQFHQHLRQLQQLFHQQPPPPPPPPPPPQPPPSHHVAHHHHQAGRPMTVPPQGPPPPRMVNLCQATQTTILAPNPMLQGALLMQQMQGNMRGYAMGGQQFRQFFSAGARASLLGPVPMGVAIKTPHMGFPARHFHPHARYYNNMEFSSWQGGRKRDSEQRASGSADSLPASSADALPASSADALPVAVGSVGGSSDHTLRDGGVGGLDAPPEPPEEEPALKKLRTESSEEPMERSTVQTAGVLGGVECKSPATDSQPGDCELLEEGGSTAEAAEALEESRAVEVERGELNLQDSEEAGAEARGEAGAEARGEAGAEARGEAGPLPGPQEEGSGEAANRFYCYICNITCHNQQNFQGHMNGLSHQQKMMEIQHMSNACLVTLLPRVQETLQGARRDGEKRPGLQRWCASCQTHFTSNVLEHRRTKEHKRSSCTASPSCTVCKRLFRTPRLFVQHMQSDEHRQLVQELREESGTEALAEMVAMDADGCYVDDGEEEEEGEQVSSDRQEGSRREVALEDMADDEEHQPDTVYGSSFMVPVAGFLCRLCHQFYHFESSARHTHCTSLEHFNNLKKFRSLQSPKAAAPPLDPLAEASLDGLEESGGNLSSGSECLSGDELLESDVEEPGLNHSALLQPTVSITRLASSLLLQPQDHQDPQSPQEPQPQDSQSPQPQDHQEPQPQDNQPPQGLFIPVQEDPPSPSPPADQPSTSPPADLPSTSPPADPEEEILFQGSPEQLCPLGLEVTGEEAASNPALVPGEAEKVEEEVKAPVPEEKPSMGKAKAPPKRRSGRAARRR
ncbi:cdkn1a interacting zinc finger protein 1a [Hypomesus transpacificus]|uniref:cdkn1a interacting zinc finger protein 1a n=1 Tax=Hypomesus transpacificus TaxID=137520 RepID=UPI001F0776AA|nr:cdkn1a interacting zinc finger protein 1a [Hypomesus transpacificus]